MHKSSTLPIPHEHGAWAMFFVPLVVGLAVGASRRAADNQLNLGVIILFALTAFGFFLLRYPLALAIKSRDPNARRGALRWSVAYALLTFIGGIGVLMLTQLWWLAVLGGLGGGVLVIYLALVRQRQEMSVIGEWTGIVGAALTAPIAYSLLTRSIDATALLLYVLNVLFFGGTVYYIKFKVREQMRLVPPASNWRTRLWAGRAPILYNLIVLAIVAVFVVFDWVSPFALGAMFLPLLKSIWGVLNRPARLNIPRLGIVELVVSIMFAVLAVMTF